MVTQSAKFAGSQRPATGGSPAQGSFEHLAPGRYLVIALQHPQELPYRDAAALERYLPLGKEVTLTPNAKSEVQLGYGSRRTVDVLFPNEPIPRSCPPNYSGREKTHASFPGRTLLGVASLVLALVCATAAQQQEPLPSSSSATWRIVGKVVDARSGQALARCVVGINTSQERTQSVSTVTGEDGQFVFAGLELGIWLTAARRGDLTQSYQQHESFSTAIAVGPNLNTEG